MNRTGDNLISFGANEALVRELSRENVEFLVVGGLAVAWYCQERMADDMDLLINPTECNSSNVIRALSTLGLQVPDGYSFAKPGIQAPLKHMYYADLITPQNAEESFDALRERSVAATLFGYPTQVVGKADLIKMKRAAINSEPATTKHAEDLNRLLESAV